MNLTPVIGRISVAQPLVRKTDSSGKADTAIDYQDSAVRAPIHTVNSPRGDRMIIGERTPGLLESLEICLVQSQAGTDAVEQHAHPHTSARALGQRIAKLGRNLTGVKQERLEVDTFARALDGFQHGRKDHFSVMEKLNFIPSNRQWIRQGMSGGKKLRVIDRKLVIEIILDRVAADKENTEDDRCPQENRQRQEPGRCLSPEPASILRSLLRHLKGGLTRGRSLERERAVRRPALCQERTNHQLDLVKEHQGKNHWPDNAPRKQHIRDGHSRRQTLLRAAKQNGNSIRAIETKQRAGKPHRHHDDRQEQAIDHENSDEDSPGGLPPQSLDNSSAEGHVNDQQYRAAIDEAGESAPALDPPTNQRPDRMTECKRNKNLQNNFPK